MPGPVKKMQVRLTKLILLVFIFMPVCLHAEDTDTAREKWEELNREVIKAYNQGNYKEGIKRAEAAFQYANEHFGSDHPDTLTSMNNLAALYRAQGRYEDAEPLYKKALQLSEAVLGSEHPSTLTSVNNLAGLYESQGRYGEDRGCLVTANLLYRAFNIKIVSRA
jgi:tetratricopeptide (TPR) repeat protein